LLGAGPEKGAFFACLGRGKSALETHLAQPSEAIVLQSGKFPDRVYSTLSSARSRAIDGSALPLQVHRQRALSHLELARDVAAVIALAEAPLEVDALVCRA
jgi:hypothetical protein